MSDLARIMEVIRDAATRNDDLVVALRTCQLPGSEQAAQRLADGESLPVALAGLIPARLSALLNGGLPPLATVAALLADEAWRSDKRSRMIWSMISYPLVSLLTVSLLAYIIYRVIPHNAWYGSLVTWSWSLPPAILALALMLAPWMPKSWPMPGSAWCRHLDLASGWTRAALAVRWRLTEAQAAHILGVDLVPFAGVLGNPGAEDHCRMLADWHHRAANRRLTMTAFFAAALILAAGGGIVLAAMRVWLGLPV